MLFREKFKTNSSRLQNWDYSSEAVYFITIVTKNRKSIFGAIEGGKMILNENGKIIEKELLKSIKIRKNWFFHNWIITPNHIHLLVEIQKAVVSNNMENAHHIVETHCSASTSSISTTENNISDVSLSTSARETHCSAPLQDQMGSGFSRKPNSISSFVAIFKSITTKQINGVESIWQTNYHDHIVRNYKMFEKIYVYIKHNPISWETDSLK
jgi:REP element-mobilizing transposase RayT